MRALISHISPPILVMLWMLYLSSFSGPSCPSLIEHHRPLNVALVRVALKFASNSSWLSLAFSDLAWAGAPFGFSASPGFGAFWAKAVALRLRTTAETIKRRLVFMVLKRWTECAKSHLRCKSETASYLFSHFQAKPLFGVCFLGCTLLFML